MKTPILILAGIATLSVLLASAAHATICAMVATEPYGEEASSSLNLRLKPSIRSKILEKIEGGSILVLDEHFTLDFKGWVYVSGSVTEEGYERSNPRGWVSKKYVQSTECPEYTVEGPTSAPPQR
jgi:hypothetical protein